MLSLSPRQPLQELASAPANHYHSVIEESYRPVAAAVTYATGYAGPTLRTHTEPRVPDRFVEMLRENGIAVKVQHFRYAIPNPLTSDWRGEKPSDFPLIRVSKYERKKPSTFGPPLIHQNGGETHVTVTMPDGRSFEGVAVCSDKDLYDKRLGVYLAAKRALKALKAKSTT